MTPPIFSVEYFESHMHQSLAGFNLNIAGGRFYVLPKEQCLNILAIYYLPGHRSLAVLQVL